MKKTFKRLLSCLMIAVLIFSGIPTVLAGEINETGNPEVVQSEIQPEQQEEPQSEPEQQQELQPEPLQQEEPQPEPEQQQELQPEPEQVKMESIPMLKTAPLTAPAPASVPASVISTTQTRYVQTGNTGKLNLRQAPSVYSSVLDSYSNGTVVSVLGNFNGWAYVNVEGKYGYMMLQYLSLSAPSVTPVPTGIPWKPTTMYVQTGNSGRLYLRQGPGTHYASLGLFSNGTPVSVTAVTGQWAYVMVGGQMGYMMLKYLSYSVPPVTPVPIPVSTTMYVQTGNSGKLYLRTGPGIGYPDLGLYPNGTQVHVMSVSGEWAYVTVGGQTGYMMRKFLSPTVPVIPPAPVPTAHTVMYVSTGNTGKLYLRQSSSKSSAIIGKYPNGTQVLVTAQINEWVYVQVGGQTGYMMKQYLAQNPPTIPPAPTPISGTATVVHPKNTFVYLRSAKTSEDYSNIITKVPSGSTVEVLQWDYWWSQIRYNGLIGYMVTNYLK